MDPWSKELEGRYAQYKQSVFETKDARDRYRAEENSKDHFRVACLAIDLGEHALKYVPNSPNPALPEYRHMAHIRSAYDRLYVLHTWWNAYDDVPRTWNHIEEAGKCIVQAEKALAQAKMQKDYYARSNQTTS
ncbi:uncharacterized protein N7496_004425 [Penicillium cataractarum]|uniref:Uncharacterized protein n=1 Tax=Penicillium cataractarum TaxID=2100454 RepID=A0A9W9SNZ3_9EURO|nr:uncharacterized protein N7496_004425 [Penicillium cataractarum]KAJ5381997.1 hypothetical protein N7496_004425 [Penicillium cataractarum]